MTRRWAVAAAVCVVGLLSGDARSQAPHEGAFETKMYSIEEIRHFGADSGKLATLTDSQKDSLLASRDDLFAMLQAIEHRRDVRKYVSAEMVRKYRTSDALAASIVGPETSIMAAGVSDFNVVDKGTIRLNFFALLFADGNIIVAEKTAVLTNTVSGWRVAGID